MNWNIQDNKHYRGPIDRIHVSLLESYEVSYYIDHYLQKRSKDLTEGNRKLVGEAMMRYSGRAPIQRDDLDRFLDKHFGIS
jgi:hypothetical protein